MSRKAVEKRGERSVEDLMQARLRRIQQAVALERPDRVPVDRPEPIHATSTKLVRELGPAGFILQSGCDIPTNAKLENVQAMVAAAVRPLE